MKTVVFPFHTVRTDRFQGPLSRGIPRLVVSRMAAAGARVTPVDWTVLRGLSAEEESLAAHVVMEGPLPRSVVEGVGKTLGAAQIITGEVASSRGSACLACEVSSVAIAAGSQSFRWTGPPELSIALRDMVAMLAEVLGVCSSAACEGLPANEAELRALVVDEDNQALLKVAGPHAIEQVSELWRWRFAAAAASDTPDAHIAALEARAEGWRSCRPALSTSLASELMRWSSRRAKEMPPSDRSLKPEPNLV